MTDWLHLVSGGFAYMDAPFAVHSYDKERAEIYRDAVKSAGLGWTDVEGHVLAYAAKQGWTSEKTADELERVRAFLKM